MKKSVDPQSIPSMKRAIEEETQPPREPPDPPQVQQQPIRSANNKTRTFGNATEMKISDSKVEMIATPAMLYKVIRVVNHFIEHIIKHYPSEDDNIGIEETWYKHWKTMYPIIKSSKRSMIDVYRMLFNDYTMEDKYIDIYTIVMALKDMIPHLKHSYDILPVDDEKGKNEMNKNRFQLIITLYTGVFKDYENSFQPLDEIDSIGTYRGFHESRSITTWHTVASKASVDSEQQNTIPSDVLIDHESKSNKSDSSSQVSTPSITMNPMPRNVEPPAASPTSKSASQITNDSNLSYSQQTPAYGGKNVRFTRNQTIIRDEIIKDCQLQINNGMKGLQSSMQTLMTEQTNILKNIASSNNTHQIPQTPIRVTSRNLRNQPSPHHTPQIQNSQQPSSTRVQQQSHPRQQAPYQRSGSIIFYHNGSSYELRDQQYAKNSSDLCEVKDKMDLVQFYEEMQSDAISYNIFLQQFDLLTPWTKYTSNTLPPTCILTSLDSSTNTIDAYNRMKNALYTKLSKATIQDPEYKAIVKHGSIGKDGFEILYELMTLCHPKLTVATNKTRDTNPRPSLTSVDSIYSYAEKLSTWLTIDSIKGLKYSDDQVLDIFMEEMCKDVKYEKAVNAINSELTIKDTMLRNVGMTNFPEHLKIYHLPSTVMSYYNKDERNALFPTEGENGEVIRSIQSTSAVGVPSQDHELETGEMVTVIMKAIYDSTDGIKRLTRDRIDEICEGCGMHGHNVYQTGCDRCAQYLMIKKYLENNPQSIKGILSKYKKRQKDIAQQRRSKGKNDSPPKQPQKRYNTRFSKARVKKLQDAINQAMESESEDNDNESYSSAVQSDDEEDTSNE